MNDPKPLYIFDLDGTLADCEHRRHHLTAPANWPAFFQACDKDVPMRSVIDTMRTLQRGGAECWVWSGRSDAVRSKTIDWFHKNDLYGLAVNGRLRMRRDGDFTPDDTLKLAWLNEMAPLDRQRLVAIFDDRDKVVAMWRKVGVACFQVAPGDF